MATPRRFCAFVNTALAKTWREEAETANPEPLLARRENYSADALPYRILYLTAGVDVQDDRFEIEVVGWRQDTRKDPEESWSVTTKSSTATWERARSGSSSTSG